MGRPLLLIDVDGVLALRNPRTDGYQLHRVVSSIGEVHELWLNPTHGVALTILAQVYDIVWATGWEHDAPRTLGPLLSIPAFPVVGFTQRPRIGTHLDKLPDIERVAADRPTAWIDDEPGTAGRRWARARQTPTLLIEPKPDLGLDERHVSALLHFAVSVDPSSADRQRAAVVIVDSEGLAVIERQRDGSTYFVLPGGGIEPGESVQEAAARETLEETGLHVEIIGSVAHILRVGDQNRALQHYLAAQVLHGTFGPGSGPEYTDPDRGRGAYWPTKIPLAHLASYDCRPTSLTSRLVDPTAVQQLLSAPLLALDPVVGGSSRPHPGRHE